MSEEVARCTIARQTTWDYTYIRTNVIEKGLESFSPGDKVVIIPEEEYDRLLKESQLWRESMAKSRELFGDLLKRDDEPASMPVPGSPTETRVIWVHAFNDCRKMLPGDVYLEKIGPKTPPNMCDRCFFRLRSPTPWIQKEDKPNA